MIEGQISLWPYSCCPIAGSKESKGPLSSRIKKWPIPKTAVKERERSYFEGWLEKVMDELSNLTVEVIFSKETRLFVFAISE